MAGAGTPCAADAVQQRGRQRRRESKPIVAAEPLRALARTEATEPRGQDSGDSKPNPLHRRTWARAPIDQKIRSPTDQKIRSPTEARMEPAPSRPQPHPAAPPSLGRDRRRQPRAAVFLSRKTAKFSSAGRRLKVFFSRKAPTAARSSLPSCAACAADFLVQATLFLA